MVGGPERAPAQPRIPREHISAIIEKADAAYMELYPAVADLTEDEAIDLIALTWIGRGRFDARDFERAWALANRQHRGDSARQVLSAAHLGGLLERGLTLLSRTSRREWRS